MARGGRFLRSWRGTSIRTYAVQPAATILFELLVRRRLRIHLLGLPFMLWGYMQYRLCGGYLMKRGEGSGFGAFAWGIGPPRHESMQAPSLLITTGPYALTRNPMYMGHAIFTAGLALTTRSPFALLLCIYHGWYLHQRALQDEQALSERFGEEYAAYRARTPLWLPGMPSGQRDSAAEPVATENA
jgi:hypothetical protein